MGREREHIADGRVLALLEGCLKQEVMTEAVIWAPMAGTPQGAVINPLFAIIYL
jgi:hypothetical protein